MRNLKKTLALVLVIAMMFSVVITAGAVKYGDFSDVDQITYDEAVEVLVGLGIINGFDTGDFQPAGSVTRAQMAKMICIAKYGKDFGSAFVGDTQYFSDVPLTHWAAGYINYCVNQGIINGYGDGTFGPEDKVTAAQAVKMLLVALGYGKNNEFTGSLWMVNAIAQADDVKLFTDNEDAAVNSSAAREEAALYIFNALTRAKMVSYDSDTKEYTERDNTLGESKFSLANIKGQATLAKDGDIIVGGTNFEVAGSVDLEYRDVGFWVKGAGHEVISAVELTDTILGTSTDGTSIARLTDPDEKAYIGDLAENVEYYINGALVKDNDDADAIETAEAAIVPGSIVKLAASVKKDGINRVFITNYSMSVVNAVTAAKNNNEATITIEAAGGDITAAESKTVGFDGLSKNDVVLYYEYTSAHGFKTLVVQQADSMDAQATSYSNKNETVKLGGTSYGASGLAVDANSGLTKIRASANSLDMSDALTSEQTYYFDASGYVLARTEVAAEGDYAVLLYSSPKAQSGGLSNGYATGTVYILALDGTVESYDYKLDKEDDADLIDLIEDNAWNEDTQPKLITFEADGDMLTDMSIVDSTDTLDGATAAKAKALPLDSGDPSSLKLNSSTQFVFAEIDHETDTLSSGVFRGYSNLPALSDDTVIYYVANSSGVASLVFVVHEGTDLSNITTSDYFYALEDGSDGDNYGAYTTVDFANDGSIVELKIKKSLVSSISAGDLFNSYTENSDGIVTAMGSVDLSESAQKLSFIADDGSYVTINGSDYDITSGTAVYDVSAPGAVTEGSLEIGQRVSVYSDSGKAVVIYITEQD